MNPSLYRIEVLFSNGVCENTYAFKFDDAERYITDKEHMQKVGAVLAKLYAIYVINGLKYQVVREIIHFQ